MNQRPSYFLLGGSLALIFLLCNFQCGDPDCEYPYVLRDWQAGWLDNSGIEPLPSTGPVPRMALGIRIAAQMSNDGQDTLQINDLTGCFPLALEPIDQLEVLTIEGFDSLAGNTNINDRFRLRVSQGSTLRYLPLNDALGTLNFPPPNTSYQIDLLMIDPPSQPGLYRFLVKIGFDSLSQTISSDTSFTLPLVQLQ